MNKVQKEPQDEPEYVTLQNKSNLFTLDKLRIS
jgi:hypothetical protein